MMAMLRMSVRMASVMAIRRTLVSGPSIPPRFRS
jgi:hypothetical protein